MFAPHGVSPIDLVIAAMFGSVWQGGPAFAVVPGGWSVCIEVAFYVALPLLIRLINGRIIRALALTALSMLCTELWLLYLKHFDEFNFQTVSTPIVQAPVFMFGITAALVAMRYNLRSRPALAMGLILVAMTVVPLLHIPGIAPHIAFAMVVAVATALVARHAPPVLGSRAMGRIGEVSYSLYLIHFAVLFVSFRAATALIPADNALTLLVHFAITFPVSFVLASVSYRFVEQPCIRWAARRTRKGDALRLAGMAAE
jgi:peptidoglycan/LPS O-acetylase OafA/YrhL